MQSNRRFDKHISKIIRDASKVLGCIKFTLHEAPEKGKLLPHTSLCRPILEYGDTLWGPPEKKNVNDIELLQNKATRFVKNIKGRSGVSEARSQLQPLQDHRKQPHRLSLLMRVLSDDTKHQALASAYEEMKNNNRNLTTVSTRGEPTSNFASRQAYNNNSFLLPCAVRTLKRNTQGNN